MLILNEFKECNDDGVKFYCFIQKNLEITKVVRALREIGFLLRNMNSEYIRDKDKKKLFVPSPMPRRVNMRRCCDHSSSRK